MVAISVTLGRQFDDQRPGRSCTDAINQLASRVLPRAEHHAALLGIGTGNVQFVGRDAVAVVQFLNDADIFVHGKSKNVDDNGTCVSPQVRHLLADEPIHAHVLETDRVQHAGRSREKAWRAVPFNGMERSALDGYSANPGKIDEAFKLLSVADCAAGKYDRIRKNRTRDFHG